MNLYTDQFNPKHDFPFYEKPEKVLIIASTGRSGSHMLGHTLHKTNKFGFPLEYANPRNLAKWKEILGTSSNLETIKKIQQRRTSPNGVFSIKIHYEHIIEFGGFNNIKELFPDAFYILLSRENVLKQAISYAMACETGVWISGMDPADSNPKYNYNLIDQSLRRIILDNSSWRYTLASNGMPHSEMTFEEISRDINKAIEKISKFMNISIDTSEIPNKAATKKQSNQLNTEWEKKYLAEHQNKELILIKNSFKSRIKKLLKN